MSKKIDVLLRRGVAEIIVEEELKKLLQSGRPLRLKQGFDPSRPDIHLGHVVGLRKLRQFQELGHRVILIVGDWTARIGDPSGQSATRPMLSAAEVRANAQTYLQQFFKVVDRDKTEICWQSEWFRDFTLDKVIALTRRFTLAQMLAREDFARRHAAGRPIALTELLYPLLQAYDSTVIEADVEFGGIDQKFNCLVGRELQQMMGQRPQQVFLVPLLVGTDGVQKMSKSLGNYIGVADEPGDMYGKVMSLPDSLILPYFELLTDVPDLSELKPALAAGSVNPMTLKKRLAREIVSQFHSPQAAAEAEAHFETVFQRRETPEEVPSYVFDRVPPRREGLEEVPSPSTAVDLGDGRYLLSLYHALREKGLVSSRSELRRLLAQGAIEVEGEKMSRDPMELRSGSVVKVGKRGFVRILVRDATP